MYLIEGKALSPLLCTIVCVTVSMQVVNHLDNAVLQVQFNNVREEQGLHTRKKYSVIFTMNTRSCHFIFAWFFFLKRPERGESRAS